MKANFKQLKVEVAFDRYSDVDVRKALGNAIHASTSDIGLDDVARAIYHSEGEIEISGEHAAQIVELMNFRDCMLLAAVKRAVINALTVEES